MWREFVELAEKREVPFAALCACYGVSRKTGYKWLNRFRSEGPAGLVEQSRRPKLSPRKTPDAVVEAVLAVRRENPEWSTTRIRTELERQEVFPRPAPSTIDLILRRHREAAAQSGGPSAVANAHSLEPNYHWVVNLGRFVHLNGGAAVMSVAVEDQTTGFVVGAAVADEVSPDLLRDFLAGVMERHGMPWRITLPVAESEPPPTVARRHSPLSVWLMQCQIAVDFRARPNAVDDGARRLLNEHLANLAPFQRDVITQHEPPAGLLDEFARQAPGVDRPTAEALLNQLRERHNFVGRQEALQRRAPISLYRPSPRRLPATVTEPSYAAEAEVRWASEKGIFTFQRRLVHLGRGFAGHCVELRPTAYADHFAVIFAGQILGTVDLAGAAVDETTSLSVVAS